MFGIKYRYQLNESAGTIVLSPTRGSIARSVVNYVLGSILPLAILGAIGLAAEKQVRDFNKTLNRTED